MYLILFYKSEQLQTQRKFRLKESEISTILKTCPRKAGTDADVTQLPTVLCTVAISSALSVDRL